LSQTSVEASQEHLRYGLLHCDVESAFQALTSTQIGPWQTQIGNWTGKSEELRKNLPFLETLAQLRESDLEPLRALAVELRANCDDIVLVGSGATLDLARLAELFTGTAPSTPRLHVPRAKEWESMLLPQMGGRTGLVVLGYNPGDPCWERTVTPALEWFKERFKGDELTRRVAGVSARPLPQLLNYPLRHLSVPERSSVSPVFSGIGLFPLFLAGYEASSLVEGARSQVRALEKAWNLDNPLLRFAVVRQVLAMQEGWGEVVVLPDRFSEPLGQWCQRLLEPSSLALDPPVPYPFPHLACTDHDPHAGDRGQSLEIQIDYGGRKPPDPAAMDRGRPRLWVGMPRLDMYTLGGCLAFLSTAVGLNHRWLNIEYPTLEAE
jgi:hypothetical protein